MIIMATCHTPNIAELAAETWDNNKVKYAERHGYATCAKTDDWVFEPRFMVWERIQFIVDLLDTYTDCEWIWLTGTDSMVMNHNIKIEDKVLEADPDNKYDIIVSSDFNEIINNDSMLIRNSENSRAYFGYCLEAMPDYVHHRYAEQGFMIDTYEQYADIIKLMPQRFMNSYEYRMYRVQPWMYQDTKDVHGNDGQWREGDWFVHWPGTQYSERMQLLKEYQEKIIY
jgi:hypothetical protein